MSKAEENKQNPLTDEQILARLRENFNMANLEYSKAHKRMRKLDAVDNGDLWNALQIRYPKYQILPDTNSVSYVKNNILASIYTVGKCANVVHTSAEDEDIVTQLNLMLSYIWGKYDVPMYQLKAGERAALLNLGVTQVGWDNNIIESVTPLRKGKLKLKNINPLRYMRDPQSDSLDTAAYVITWDRYHKTILKSHKLYGEKFKALMKNKKLSDNTITSTIIPMTDRATDTTTAKDYYTVYTHFVRQDDGTINEIHTLDNQHILYLKEDIQPSMFPFAELYCNLPNTNLVGASEPAKIFANSLAYNLMNSVVLTAEYKNQRPPKFVSNASGLNVAAFTKHGNDADRTFIVQGDASKAVHYHQFPTPTATAFNSMALLSNDIKSVSGVDDRYTGRDTGSVLTTGGIENMLAQVTLIDTTKVTLYENYTKRLTELIVANFVDNSTTSRTYFFKHPETHEHVKATVDFPKLDSAAVFDYEIAISSYLPKNKAQIKAMADNLMQMQMQYAGAGIDVDLITPQEWMRFQDFPLAEAMLERMGLQRSLNWQQATAQIIEQYTSLVESGIDPAQAMELTADTIAAQQEPGGKDGVQEAYENQMLLAPQTNTPMF